MKEYKLCEGYKIREDAGSWGVLDNEGNIPKEDYFDQEIGIHYSSPEHAIHEFVNMILLHEDMHEMHSREAVGKPYKAIENKINKRIKELVAYVEQQIC